MSMLLASIRCEDQYDTCTGDTRRLTFPLQKMAFYLGVIVVTVLDAAYRRERRQEI